MDFRVDHTIFFIYKKKKNWYQGRSHLFSIFSPERTMIFNENEEI